MAPGRGAFAGRRACYAELATAYPKEGGDYVYLTRALGRSVGFLFAWCQLWIVRPGSIGAMAYLFAELRQSDLARAEGAAVLRAHGLPARSLPLPSVNLLGIREGKWTQNVLTTAKVLGLAAIVCVGLQRRAASAAPRHGRRVRVPLPTFGLA